MRDTNLQDFLPRTLDERLAKLRERLGQAWPTFRRVGGYDYTRLYRIDYDPGTIVRFYRPGKPITFDPVGAVKHGAAWYLSAPIDGVTKFNNTQMQAYLETNELGGHLMKSELLYWAAIVVVAAIAVWRHNKRTPTNDEFKRGEADGRNYLEAGVFPASITSYIEVQKSRGLSGPYEQGLKKALTKARTK